MAIPTSSNIKHSMGSGGTGIECPHDDIGTRQKSIFRHSVRAGFLPDSPSSINMDDALNVRAPNEVRLLPFADVRRIKPAPEPVFKPVRRVSVGNYRKERAPRVSTCRALVRTAFREAALPVDLSRLLVTLATEPATLAQTSLENRETFSPDLGILKSDGVNFRGSRRAREGGFYGRALGHAIFTEGETWEQLRANVLEAVEAHFESGPLRPRLVQLHYVKDELIAIEAA